MIGAVSCSVHSFRVDPRPNLFHEVHSSLLFLQGVTIDELARTQKFDESRFFDEVSSFGKIMKDHELGLQGKEQHSQNGPSCLCRSAALCHLILISG